MLSTAPDADKGVIENPIKNPYRINRMCFFKRNGRLALRRVFWHYSSPCHLRFGRRPRLEG